MELTLASQRCGESDRGDGDVAPGINASSERYAHRVHDSPRDNGDQGDPGLDAGCSRRLRTKRRKPDNVLVATHSARQKGDFVVGEAFAGMALMSRWYKAGVENNSTKEVDVKVLMETDDTMIKFLHEVLPSVHIEDVNDISSSLADLDVLFAGWPCNVHSPKRHTMGKKDLTIPLEHHKSGLIQVLLARIQNLSGCNKNSTSHRPKLILLENVEQALGSVDEHGEIGGFWIWLINNLNSLGYDGEWRLFTSGCPSMSGNRVFILAYLRDALVLVERNRGTLFDIMDEGDPADRKGRSQPWQCLGFTVAKNRESHVNGRYGCLTSGTDACLVYHFGDLQTVKAVQLQASAVGKLFKVGDETMECFKHVEASQSDIMKAFANCCRPIGKEIMRSLAGRLTSGKFFVPSNDQKYKKQPGARFSSCGYWQAGDRGAAKLYEYKVKKHEVLKEGESPRAHAVEFTEEALENKEATYLSLATIESYCEKAAVLPFRQRERRLACLLGFLWYASDRAPEVNGEKLNDVGLGRFVFGEKAGKMTTDLGYTIRLIPFKERQQKYAGLPYEVEDPNKKSGLGLETFYAFVGGEWIQPEAAHLPRSMKLTAFSQGVINNDPSGFKKYEKGRHDLGKVVDVDTGSGSDWLANVCISPGDLRKYFVNDDSEDVMNSMCQNCGGTGGDEQFILCSGGESDGSLCNNGAHANCAGFDCVPDGDWLCRACESKARSDHIEIEEKVAPELSDHVEYQSETGEWGWEQTNKYEKVNLDQMFAMHGDDNMLKDKVWPHLKKYNMQGIDPNSPHFGKKGFKSTATSHSHDRMEETHSKRICRRCAGQRAIGLIVQGNFMAAHDEIVMNGMRVSP